VLALKGYFNGKEFLPLEPVYIQPNRKVIITVLDEFVKNDESIQKPFRKYIGKLDLHSANEINEALKDTERIDFH
jgi:hypothetical protein